MTAVTACFSEKKSPDFAKNLVTLRRNPGE
jgi:hypothetical protein